MFAARPRTLHHWNVTKFTSFLAKPAGKIKFLLASGESKSIKKAGEEVQPGERLRTFYGNANGFSWIYFFITFKSTASWSDRQSQFINFLSLSRLLVFMKFNRIFSLKVSQRSRNNAFQSDQIYVLFIKLLASIKWQNQRPCSLPL